MHPKRYTDSFNTTQTTQIPYPQHRKKKFEIDTTQQKQRKQLISTDRKNIFT